MDLLQPKYKTHVSQKAKLDYVGNSLMKKNNNHATRSSHEMRKYLDSLQLNVNRYMVKNNSFSERKENKDPVTLVVGIETNVESVIVHLDRVEYDTMCEGMVLIVSLLYKCFQSGTLT